MIWAVTSPERVHEEAVRINRLLSVADVLLLRKPGWTSSEYAVLLEQICPHYRSRIMISEQAALLMEYGLMGIHVSEYARQSASAETLARYAAMGVPLSTSIHQPVSPGDIWKYLLLGPVFNSISKPGYMGQAAGMLPVPANAIAIGGVDVPHMANVRAMGFCGAAVLGALWQEDGDIAEIYQRIKNAWKSVSEAGVE